MAMLYKLSFVENVEENSFIARNVESIRRGIIGESKHILSMIKQGLEEWVIQHGNPNHKSLAIIFILTHIHNKMTFWNIFWNVWLIITMIIMIQPTMFNPFHNSITHLSQSRNFSYAASSHRDFTNFNLHGRRANQKKQKLK